MNNLQLKYFFFNLFLNRDLQSEKFIKLMEFEIPKYVIERFVQDYNVDE